MFEHANTTNKQANQGQEMVPLTPEVAREIEKQLDKHAETLQNLKVRYGAGFVTTQAPHQPTPEQV